MIPEPSRQSGRPVIIGAGLAGLIAALRLAPQPVLVVSKAPLGLGVASGWSQGGLAAAMLADDSPARHAADTLEAGDGLCDAETVRRITEAGPAAVASLEALGVVFTRGPDGNYACKLEAAHSRRRVLNAGGDGTGAEIMWALVARVRETPSIEIADGLSAEAIDTDDVGVCGLTLRAGGGLVQIPTRAVVVATGGCGGLWQHTTNPSGALGQGLALAARAGAELVDLEFIQFHPTALDIGRDPLPLATEALRGEGAVLVDESGNRIMASFARGDLEPRDVVSRAVWAAQQSGRRVSLDATRAVGQAMKERFPTVASACLAAGIDPAVQPMPIRPAAHYQMGGIAVDSRCRASVDGLWACGEVAGTGLHGANRLASNSLLEAVVTGLAVADDLAGISTRPASVLREPPADSAVAPVAELREIMSRHVGVLRDASGLDQALRQVTALADGAPPQGATLTALAITLAASRRDESRGAHFRTDFPERKQAAASRRFLRLADIDDIVKAYA